MTTLYVFIAWLFLVILWNFGYPSADPAWDVIVAVALSLASKKASTVIENKP